MHEKSEEPLYISTQKRKHDYSFLVTNQDKILPSLCCNLCNAIISNNQKNDNNILLKIRGISRMSTVISRKKIVVLKISVLYQTFLRVENVLTIASNAKMPFATNTKKGYTWRTINIVCNDFSYQKIIERQIAKNMKGNTIKRKLQDMYSQLISLPNDGTTIRLSTKHVNQRSHGLKRTSISFLDSNGKQYMKKLNR